MPCDRRQFIKHSFAVTAYSAATASGFYAARRANAAPVGVLEQTLLSLFKGSKITETDKISLQIPKIAENGAVVPLTITSSLEKVLSVYILVEKNPIPLTAKFDLSPELDAKVSARLKMAETSDVIVVVETNEGLYSAREKVKVTIGGCGG